MTVWTGLDPRRLHPAVPLRALTTWPRTSQERSRRNAMLAGTALLELRRERAEVQQFIADALAHRTTTADGAPREEARHVG